MVAIKAQNELFHNQLKFYKAGVYILFLLLGISLTVNYIYISADPQFDRLSEKKPNLPYEKQIMEIISPLHYTALPQLFDPEIHLDLDFANKQWRIKNIRKFDENGRIMLGPKHNGLCGDLVTYVYQNVEPLLKSRYKIKMLKVTEAGYFQSQGSDHYALGISQGIPPLEKVYIIDPAFQKYDSRDRMDSYSIIKVLDPKIIINNPSPDYISKAGSGVPILFHKSNMVNLYVSGVNNLFDENNYVIMMSVSQRHRFAGRILFALRRENGINWVFENKFISQRAVKRKDYVKLRDKIFGWFQELNGQVPVNMNKEIIGWKRI